MRECPSCGRLFNGDEESCPDDDCTLVPMGEADPMVGASIGNYRITKRIGRGGMGSVYSGVHPAIGSTVAIKVLHRKYASDPAMVERFFNEARAVNLIGHENIVRIFDFGHQDDGTPWFVMELLEGGALSVLCGVPRPAAEVVPIFLQIARALGAAHAAGVVHRDLKPENVFLVESAREPFVKVLDFGIAKLTRSPGTVHTHTGAVLGSARYMSPEQASGDGAKIGARSDIYSLGVLLFELTCGRVPFEATTFGDLLLAHRTQPPPRPSALAPGTPLESVILRCLQKEPQDRFASMDDVARALTEPLAPVRPQNRRWRWVVGAATVVSAALVLKAGVRPTSAARVAPQEHAAVVTLTQAPVPVPLTLGPAPGIAPLTLDPPSNQLTTLLAEDSKGVVRTDAVPGKDQPKSSVRPHPAKRTAPLPTPPPEARDPRYVIPDELGDGMVEVEW